MQDRMIVPCCLETSVLYMSYYLPALTGMGPSHLDPFWLRRLYKLRLLQVCGHEITFREINSHVINSYNFSQSQLLEDQLS